MKSNITVALFAAIGTLAIVHFSYSDPFDKNKEAAFQECLEEVKNKCSGVISYAVALEAENAAINRKLHVCRGRN